MVGAVGILSWWIGALAWLCYGLSRLLGAPAFNNSAIASQPEERWQATVDLSGDGSFTATDVSLWSGWIAYAPGDLFITVVLDTPLGVFVDPDIDLFGGTLSALISMFVYFLVSASLFVEGLPD